MVSVLKYVTLGDTFAQSRNMLSKIVKVVDIFLYITQRNNTSSNKNAFTHAHVVPKLHEFLL